MSPVEESFWQRINGSLDFGFSFTQDQSATEYNLNAEAKYLTDCLAVKALHPKPPV